MTRWFAPHKAKTLCASILASSGALADDRPRVREIEVQQVVEVEEVAPSVFDLKQLTSLAMERNPILSQAAFRIDAAQGRTLQAGLRPNPVLSVTGDELGDRQGAAGIWTAPQLSQEFVTGGKLRIARAASAKEIDQASFGLASRKFALLGDIRTAYFDALAVQTRVEIVDEILELSSQSLKQTKALFDASQVAELDVVQLEVERERLLAEREAMKRELPPALAKMAAVVGAPDIAIARIAGTIESFPPWFDRKSSSQAVWNHPDVHSAQAGVERARLLVDRARAQPIPNFTMSAGYVRQSQNRSNDWTVGISVPIPVNDRNQGNIRAALAELGEATREVERVENSLRERLAASFRMFDSARERADRYRREIIPRAKKSYELSLKAYRGGQFEYLRVLESQRAVGQARLELVRALGDAWQAASAISSLTLMDQLPEGIPIGDGSTSAK